ncbi:MAG: hypothetical protein COV91_04185 [Candidatus Taylorbacteria bacterium CG11_big_fil_rev_8_21_14_0_20_46_11]|uniref:Phosphoribosyltransferase domain-containing protein n=1 Tax=Candidatus Taylorbacteria bacterium CG11_big_fil_rev_8_21_14_0_20_46_11 TaxID=1975025 RepID=A0A2H0KB12_9BACT|nr:MAG: hypothetical protein COV91_04185 [Candidatus Taylorbacteria bacterium CG11_big_fil_rev_8_21_14_0_20_46_11]
MNEQQLKGLAVQAEALYICPKDGDGKRTGPLVVYAGKDTLGKNLVGDIYFNFRRIEENLEVVESFARAIAVKYAETFAIITTICGIPNGGRTLGQELARITKKRFVYPDKKPKPTDPGKKQEYSWDLSQFAFKQGEPLLVMEDVINNLQNTDHTLAEIAKTGAKVMCIGAALNRSPFASTSYTPKDGPYTNKALPILCSIREAFPEYTQDDSEVVEDITANNVEWEVKKNWARLMKIMART